MIKKFNQFLENNNSRYLLYYAFDWDDNILNMPTVIHMDKRVGESWVPTDVSTAEFAEVRGSDDYRILNNNPDEAFSEFRDFGPRGMEAFLIDVKSAIKQKRFGPAWDDFIECLSNGCVFAIITARGHEPEAIRLGIEWIIDNVMTEEEVYEMYNNLLKFEYVFDREEGDKILRGKPSENVSFRKYLDQCDLVGVSSPSRGGAPDNPEKSKEEALLEFKEKVNNYASRIGVKAKVGFSDDDLKNVKHIEDLIDNLNHEQFPNIIEYVVKGTKDPSSITKKVRTMSEGSQTTGLESSVLPFTQFNNMTNKLYPKGPDNRQDDFANEFRRQSEYLAKTSKETLDKKNIKNKKSS